MSATMAQEASKLGGHRCTNAGSSTLVVRCYGPAGDLLASFQVPPRIWVRLPEETTGLSVEEMASPGKRFATPLAFCVCADGEPCTCS